MHASTGICLGRSLNSLEPLSNDPILQPEPQVASYGSNQTRASRSHRPPADFTFRRSSNSCHATCTSATFLPATWRPPGCQSTSSTISCYVPRPLARARGGRSILTGRGVGRMWLGRPVLGSRPRQTRQSPQPMNVLTETRLWALDTVSECALSAGPEECQKSVPQAGVAGRERIVAPVRECAICRGRRPVATGGGVGMPVRRGMPNHAA